MMYQKIYRGEFSNTLDDGNNLPVDQVVRIDINDVASGSAEESSVIAKYTSSTNLLLVESDGHETYDELVLFFFNGQRLRLTDSDGLDGDYIVSDVNLVPPTDITTGKVRFLINAASPPGSANAEGVTFTNIPADPVIIPIQMGGNPLHISVVDNDEDKFTTIRSKQAEIKLLTGDGIDINTFCEGDDQRFYVEIFVDDLIIFRGFLMIPDMQQDFMPDPNDLLLTATDNLSLLKDIPLIETDGSVPQLDNKLISYIQWSLRQTGIIQNINIINSLKHGSGTLVSDVIFNVDGSNYQILTPATNFFYQDQRISITGTASNDGEYTIKGSGLNVVQITLSNEAVVNETASGILFTDLSSAIPFYEVVNLKAKTFEGVINTCEDCYSVLNKILTEDCVLFQYQGEWWIVRIDEIEEIAGTFQYNVDHYDSDGTFLSHEVVVKSKNIGEPDIMHFMNDDALVIPDRAYNHVRETFNFISPIEIICNIDFSRGDFIADLTPTDAEKLDGAVTAKSFNLDDWTLMRGNPEAAGSPIASDSEAYIERLYNVVDYESSRFAVITSPSTVDIATPYILSCPLPVRRLDRFESSANFKFPTNSTSGGGGTPMFRFALKGKDGSWWLLTISDDDNGFDTDPAAPKWVNTLGWTVSTSLADYQLNFAVGTDFTQWQSISYDFKKVPPIPVDGHLYILLHGLHFLSGSSYDKDVHWSSLSFTYYPLVNGSYQKFTGQYHQVSQTGNNKAIREKQVFMSDSPFLLLKGAMEFFNGVDYVPTYGFTDAHNTIPVPFGQIQAFAVWDQYRVSARNFDGEVKRLESETIDTNGKYDGVDLIDKIELTDSDLSTNNRYFLILHYEIDYYLLEMKCYIASLYRTDLGKIYTDKHIFIYTTE